MKRLVIAFGLTLLTTNASAQNFASSTGMFRYSAGIIRDSTGQKKMMFAWNHDNEEPGCSKVYYNTGEWFVESTGWYERFCIKNEFVRLMGWTTGGTANFLELRVGNELGQPYARADGEPTRIQANVDLYYLGFKLKSYVDIEIWDRVYGGISQQEIFQWTTGPEAGCTSHLFSTHVNGIMFATNNVSFMNCLNVNNGAYTSMLPARTVENWLWKYNER